MQKYIKKIEDNNNKMEIITRNQNQLAKELHALLVTLNYCLALEYQLALTTTTKKKKTKQDSFYLDQNMVSVLTFGDLEVCVPSKFRW